jgi:hypothetical protein
MSVDIGKHTNRENFFDLVGLTFVAEDYGNCRPKDECCDEPNEYYCVLMGECREITRECCPECDHYIFDPALVAGPNDATPNPSHVVRCSPDDTTEMG